MRRWVVVGLVTLALAAVAAPASAAEPDECGLRPPTITTGMATDGVVGVVERRTLARNPLPWGSSVSVATRIWGDILAERWVVSARAMAECATRPSQPVGTVIYDFRGARAEWEGVYPEVWSPETAAAADLAALRSRFGDPTELPVGSVDRVMAWLRVATTEIALVAGALVGLTVGWFRRRVRRRRDRHLF